LSFNTEALKLARKIRDRRSQAIALENIAPAYIGLDRAAEARRALRDGRKTAEAIGDRERLVSLDLVGIEERLARKELHGVDESLKQAERSVRTRGYAAERPRLLRLRVQADILSGREQQAGQTLREAIRECRRQKNRTEEKRILALKGQLGGDK
jgi:hypothetical protein